MDGLMSLVAKSLLVADFGGSAIRYRLLYVTRAYGTEKLDELGERCDTLRLHAVYFRKVLESAQIAWERMTRPEWLGRYGGMIDDVRAALDWAFAPGGDIELGAALTVASLPYGSQLSLLDEFKLRTTSALKHLAQVVPAQTEWELRLMNAYVAILVRTGAPDEVVQAAMTRALALAKENGAVSHMIQPFTAQAIYNLELGNYTTAADVMGQFEKFAKNSDDVVAILSADRVGAQVYQFVGDFARSRLLAERVIRHPMQSVPLVYCQTPIDRQVSMRATLASILWLQGFSEQADIVASEGVELAEADAPASMCQVLALAACPLAFWRGDFKAARRFTENLLDYARRNTLHRWLKLGLCYQATLDFMLQSPKSRVLNVSDPMPLGPLQRHILSTIDKRWLDKDTLSLAERGLCGWATAEIMRASGELHLMSAIPNREATAEANFRASIQVAQDQGALAWELRATTSLALLLQSQGRNAKAASMLQVVYDKYSEGFESADVLNAHLLLEQLRTGSRKPVKS
jgi:hypothetical protein